MEKNQFTAFRRTIEDLKRAAREDYERRVEKLDAALTVAEKLTQRTPRPDTEDSVTEILAAQGLTWQDPLEDNNAKPFVLKDEVRRAVTSWRGHAFRQRDITAMVQGRYPNVRVHAGSVSAALKKMAASGEIEVVKESRGGSEPSIYREVAVSP
jgi:hypothetical protein